MLIPANAMMGGLPITDVIARLGIYYERDCHYGPNGSLLTLIKFVVPLYRVRRVFPSV